MLSHSELIENYNDGLLSEKERQVVESKLATDSSFAKDFKLHQEVDDAINNKKFFAFEQTIDRIQVEYETAGKRRNISVVYKIAASLAILLTVGSMMYFGLFRVDPMASLVSQFYEPYNALTANRGETSTQNTMLIAAFNHYTNKDYKASAAIFRKLVQINPDNIKAKFFLGISLIQEKTYSEAESLFNNIILTNDVYYHSQAAWYLGMCYLMEGKKQEAKRQFTLIASKDGYYKERASKIADELK